ncbi:hypothetical protein, partial [Salmonella sp. SAL4360]|uniref:hypothetical protein n=1 Tax=Salmonella sp. SAL4360 TaxID=3159881 RepID=UPI00397A3D3F
SGGSQKHYGIFFTGAFSYTGANNDIYANGSSGPMFGSYNSSNYSTLPLWFGQTGQDNPVGASPSISTAVNFFSTTDLHVQSTDCSLYG